MFSRTRTTQIRRAALTLAFGLTATIAAFAQPKILIRDCPADNGTEPTPTSTCYYVWGSPDIKVQTTSTYSASAPHAAQAGVNNYVFVTLQNIGSSTLQSGTVHVYWAKFAANQVWSSGWINHYDAQNRLIGDEIGAASVSNLGPGNSTMVSITWPASNVPDPTNFGEQSTHICLVARVVSNEFTLNEGTNMLDNTRNNSAIGWRNTDVAKPTKPVIHCIVGNPFDDNHAVRVHFTEAGGSRGHSFRDFGSVVVDLGSDLYQLWAAQGKPGENVSDYSQDADNTKVVLDAADATLGDLNLGAHQEFTLGIDFQVQNTDGARGETFDWTIAQHNDGDAAPFGGGTITVDWAAPADYDGQGEGQGKRAVSTSTDLVRMFELSAHPNPTSGATTIGYQLPADAQVSLAIYDATGHLVRTLVDGTSQKAGAHEMEWNGRMANGTKAAAGTYFYRLSAGDKKIEGQLKITR